jgi:peroxiredoxin/outer membrane lipoprotein-sorting protein
MLQRKRILLLILTLLLTSNPNFFTSDVEVKDLLERVDETYRNLKSYRFEAILFTDVTANGKQQKMEMLVSLAIVKPAKIRVHIKDERKEILTISNEQTIWMYMDRLKQYVKKDVVLGDGSAAGDAGQAELISMVDRFADTYAHLAERAANARMLREEALQIEGNSVPCYVLKLTPPASDAEAGVETDKTLWIDKTRYVILKEVSRSEKKAVVPEDALQLTRTTVFNRVDINESLSHDLFVFQPPEGARQVENFDSRAPAAGNQARQEAPDFTLEDLDGHSFHLKSQRGKAVLIEFWASWCGPCRIEMPFVEKLYRRFQHNGLVVVGVNDEDPEVAQEFLQDKDFTFPMLVDANQEVASAYEVEAIPTLVLIDQEGHIVRRNVGLGDERKLREDLKKIGIDTHDRP